MDTSPIYVTGAFASPSTVIRDLGVWLTNDLNMSTHVHLLVGLCFYRLRRIESCRRALPLEAAKTLVNRSVVSHKGRLLQRSLGWQYAVRYKQASASLERGGQGTEEASRITSLHSSETSGTGCAFERERKRENHLETVSANIQGKTQTGIAIPRGHRCRREVVQRSASVRPSNTDEVWGSLLRYRRSACVEHLLSISYQCLLCKLFVL